MNRSQTTTVETTRKPRLTMRVGFAGKARFDPAFNDAIRGKLAEVFSVIGEELARIAPGTSFGADETHCVSEYFSDETPLLRVVTGLCEGCDQLAAEAILHEVTVECEIEGKEEGERCLETELAAVLPFPFSDYRDSRDESFRDTFDQTASSCSYIVELDGIYDVSDRDGSVTDPARQSLAKRRRQLGYQAQAQILLRQSDLLVAVADPESDGRVGGALETVRAALEFNLPVVFVNLLTQDVTLYDPGQCRAELFGPRENDTEPWRTTLSRWAERVVADPDRAVEKKEAQLHSYTTTFLEHIFYGKSYPDPKKLPAAKRWFSGRWRADRLNTFFKNRAAKSKAPKIELPKDHIAPRPQKNAQWNAWRGRITELNYEFAGQYRGAFLLNFVLGVVVVALAALSLLLQKELMDADGFDRNRPTLDQIGGGQLWVFVVLGLLKLWLLLLIVRNTRSAKRQRWNELSIDLRYLAERMRSLFFLTLVGSFQPPAVRPVQYTSRALNQSTVEWLFDAFTRAVSPASMPDIGAQEISGAKVPLLTISPGAAIDQIRDHWIGEQIEYHQGKARTEALFLRYATWIGGVFTGLAIAVVAADTALFTLDLFGELPLGLEPFRIYGSPWMGLLAAVLPAAAAAITGIRLQAECQRLAKRSATMVGQLFGESEKPGGLYGEFDALARRIRDRKAESEEDSGAWTHQALHSAEKASREFLDEAAEWTVLYSKELPRPN